MAEEKTQFTEVDVVSMIVDPDAFGSAARDYELTHPHDHTWKDRRRLAGMKATQIISVLALSREDSDAAHSHDGAERRD